MQHKEYRKYFIIVVNGINFENCESLHCTPETYTIFYINSTSTKNNHISRPSTGKIFKPWANTQYFKLSS